MSRDITTRMLYERAIAGTLVTSEILAALKEAEERGRREENEACAKMFEPLHFCDTAHDAAGVPRVADQIRARLEEK